jgi:hypothetical protein
MTDALQAALVWQGDRCVPNAADSWPSCDRQLLLAVPRLGSEVIDRLQSVGIHSLADLRAVGVDRAVDLVCHAVGSKAWRNRRAALHRAVSVYEVTGGSGADNLGCHGP